MHQCLKNIQGVIVPKESRTDSQESDEQENLLNKEVCTQLITLNFDLLIESLLVVMDSTHDQNMMQQMGNESNSRNCAVEILTFVIKQNYRRNQNQGVNANNLERYRDEILNATLRAYSPEIAPQHQCITNQVAEDLLE